MSCFTATFTESEERMVIRNGEGRDLKYWYQKKSVGSWLLDILNCDIQELERIITESSTNDPFEAAKNPNDFLFANPPSSDTFEKIISEYEFIGAYSREDWTNVFLEIVKNDNGRCLRDAVLDAKEFISLCMDHPEYWDYRFMARYLLQGVLDTDLTFRLYVYESDSPLTLQDFEKMENESFESCVSIAYKHFSEKDSTSPTWYKYEEIYPRIEGVIFTTMLELARRGKVIRICKNCGLYFIPENRSDTLYCDRISPQNANMTCKEYGSQRLSYIKQRNDELSRLSRNILSKKGTLAKRHPETSIYRESYDYFRYYRKEWIKKIELSPNDENLRLEYKNWLIRMNNNHHISEARGFKYPE